jgi:heme-degrading monooxygenase HmoA
MIKHIVSWKLRAQDAPAKAESVSAIAAALLPLATSIPGITSLTVNANSAFLETNWDVVLIGDFESLAALEAYQVHPEHVAAAAIVREHVTERATVDFEA